MDFDVEVFFIWYLEGMDFYFSFGSKVIDVGVCIFNVNDDFMGEVFDMGVLEGNWLVFYYGF